METINGEKPTTSSEIESTPKVKPQNSKMISRQQQRLFLPSPIVFFFLSYALQLSVSECVINREAHSLFILVPDLRITLGLTSLGESNNPRAPQLRGL